MGKSWTIKREKTGILSLARGSWGFFFHYHMPWGKILVLYTSCWVLLKLYLSISCHPASAFLVSVQGHGAHRWDSCTQHLLCLGSYCLPAPELSCAPEPCMYSALLKPACAQSSVLCMQTRLNPGVYQLYLNTLRGKRKKDWGHPLIWCHLPHQTFPLSILGEI